MKDAERKQVLVEVKELSENGTFSGLLSVYDVVDEYGDVVERGAYTQTLKSNGYKVPLLWQHDQAMPIGELELTDGADGLEAKGRIINDEAVPEARKAYALLRAGLVKGLSIGFKTIRSKMDGKIRRLKEIRLFEGSLVTIPANRFALVTQVKRMNLEKKDFNSELELLQLADSGYQIMCALHSALCKVMSSQDIPSQQKVDAAAEAIDQFRTAYLEFLPRYLDLGIQPSEMDGEGENMAKRLSAAPSELRSLLTNFSSKFLELEGKHPGTSRTDAARAAPSDPSRPPDTDALRSWAKEFSERWIS